MVLPVVFLTVAALVVLWLVRLLFLGLRMLIVARLVRGMGWLAVSLRLLRRSLIMPFRPRSLRWSIMAVPLRLEPLDSPSLVFVPSTCRVSKCSQLCSTWSWGMRS